MKEIFYKYKFYIISSLWVVVGVLTTLLILEDRSIEVSLPEIKKIAQEREIQEISFDSKAAYFYDDSAHIYRLPLNDLIVSENASIDGQILNLSYLDLSFKNAPKITTKIPLSVKILIALAIIIAPIFEYKHLMEKKKKERLIKRANEIIANKHREHKLQILSDTPKKNDMSLNIEPLKSSVRFSDVAGISDVKDDLLEIVDYLKNPKKYQDLGIYPPKGVLLVGPPGVGKTMIAKAIAGECGVPFFYQSGSSFVQMYVGVGAQRVRDLFARARASAPSIIFIDEIDAIGKTRSGDSNNHEWESTLNELLTEMDGFSEQSGIIVIAATNRAEVIDRALLRSGRFDRRIFVDLPNIKEREDILRVHLRNRSHNLNLHEIAKLCVGFSGANIASLVNEAALNALRHNRAEISMQDILDSTDKVMFGKRRKSALSTQQKEIMATYNAAKAISKYWFSPDFQKISLMQIPQSVKIDENSLKSDLISQIKVALSGYIALEVNGLESSSIARADLESAKHIARKMCREFGMASRLITNEEDELEILESTLNDHRDFIISNRENIAKIAQILVNEEKISKEKIALILNGETNEEI